MKTCYINVTPAQICQLAVDITEKNPDSALVLPIVSGIDTYSPTKKKKAYRIKVEFAIPEGALVGQDALTDFGCMAVMRLPKSRISPELLVEANKDKHNTESTQEG